MSYLALWAFVMLEGILIFVLIRELGLRILKTAQGISHDGAEVGTRIRTFDFRDTDDLPLLVPGSRNAMTMLVFGSKGCQPCHEMAPELRKVASRYREVMDSYFVVDEPPDGRRAAARSLDAGVPVISHPEAWSDYGVRVTPFAFVVSAEGVVLAKGLVSSRAGLELVIRQARRGAADLVGATASIADVATEVRNE